MKCFELCFQDMRAYIDTVLFVILSFIDVIVFMLYLYLYHIYIVGLCFTNLVLLNDVQCSEGL